MSAATVKAIFLLLTIFLYFHYIKNSHLKKKIALYTKAIWSVFVIYFMLFSISTEFIPFENICRKDYNNTIEIHFKHSIVNFYTITIQRLVWIFLFFPTKSDNKIMLSYLLRWNIYFYFHFYCYFFFLEQTVENIHANT